MMYGMWNKRKNLDRLSVGVRNLPVADTQRLST